MMEDASLKNNNELLYSTSIPVTNTVCRRYIVYPSLMKFTFTILLSRFIVQAASLTYRKLDRKLMKIIVSLIMLSHLQTIFSI